MTTTWTRDAVAAEILAGAHLVVYHDLLLRIPPKWLDQHPGGALSILHFVGRDATDEIDSYHPDHVLQLVRRYKVGTVELPWGLCASSTQILLVSKRPDGPDAPTRDTLEPSPSTLSADDQARHSAAYKVLHNRLLRYALLASLSAYAALFLGLFWQQLTFVAHDLGHVSVTHNWAIDRCLGILVADWIGGLSIGWWVNNHNVHHLVPNHPTHLQRPRYRAPPFIAISPVFFDSIWSSYYKRTLHWDRFAHFFVQLQHRLFYIVLLLARFNLYANSYPFVVRQAFDTKRARGGRWAWGLEVAGIVFFWCWFGSVLAGCGSWKTSLAYLLVSHVAAAPVHIQIVLSHFSMSTADMGPAESFADRQLRTTTDVICPDSIGWIHGGLHLQVTHHLFPRLPRHNLKAASLLVKEFAKEQGLVYAEFGWISGNQDVLGVLKSVADQVKIIGTVAEAEAKEAVTGSLGCNILA
ncbi:delta 8-sphingoloid desaturase protein [Mycena leptocephala]|nr:delta 8-sphingoloid desaturase protein [Mycena leptocephala]